MKLHDLHTTKGSTHRRKRVGRGDSSGWGRTCGRGEKGQKARSGANMRPFFEGGQIPLFRRLPKRGFNNPDHKVYSLVNVGELESLFSAGDTVDEDALYEKGLVRKKGRQQLKVLGNGELAKSLTVRANKFSNSARTKIESAGGTCEVL